MRGQSCLRILAVVSRFGAIGVMTSTERKPEHDLLLPATQLVGWDWWQTVAKASGVSEAAIGANARVWRTYYPQYTGRSGHGETDGTGRVWWQAANRPTESSSREACAPR